MPFIPHTPESLLPRSDSKNPNSTCRGITSNGTPCRRAITRTPGASPQVSPQASPYSKGSTRTSSPDSFCWQHKDQAVAQTTSTPSPNRHRPTVIRERTSVDTLVDRLGLLEVEERKKGHKHHRKTYPPGSNSEKTSRRTSPEAARPRPKPNSNLRLFCCIGVADESRRAPRTVIHNDGAPMTARMPAKVHSKSPSGRHSNPQRPTIGRDPLSQTGEFLALIPKTASPQTTALLLAELAKPFSEQDTDGFIYMFWLTPESIPAEPPAETVSSLLGPPSRPAPGHRRTSDVINTFAKSTPNASNKKTMLLKIGRAQNVQRRLNQWTRQCGYNLSLIRYYPYNPTTLSVTNPNQAPRTPKKVPNVNKVERLIHIELDGIRVKGSGKCASCGREHKEWFEVDASRDGVKTVDEVIRRWADWSARQAAK